MKSAWKKDREDPSRTVWFPKRRGAFVGLAVALWLPGPRLGAAPGLEAPEEAAAVAPVPQAAKGERGSAHAPGIELSWRALGRRKRAARAAREALLSVTLEARTGRPFGYRRRELPPGLYDLAIVEEAGEAPRLLVAFRPRSEAPPERAGDAAGAPGRTAESREGAPNEEESVEESAGEGGGGEAKRTGRAGPGKKRGGPARASASGRDLLRVPLKLAQARAASEDLEVRLKPIDKGRRLRLLLRLGPVEATALLRDLTASRAGGKPGTARPAAAGGRRKKEGGEARSRP